VDPTSGLLLSMKLPAIPKNNIKMRTKNTINASNDAKNDLKKFFNVSDLEGKIKEL
jgi:hypothetical protein